MNNLGVYSIVLEYLGRPRPTSITAYVCAGLNFILFAYFFIKMYKSTGLNIQNGTVLLVLLIETICTVIYYSVDATKGAGFITLNILYYALVWLSFISIFPLWARKLHSAEVKTHPVAAKTVAIFAYVYAFITIIVAMVAETKAAGAASSFDSLGTNQKYLFNDLAIFLYLMYFLSTQNFSKLSTHNYKTSAAAFFVLATIAVATDTAMIFTMNFYRFAQYPLMLQFMISFVSVDFCNFVALLVVLIFSSKWRSSFDKSQYISSSTV